MTQSRQDIATLWTCAQSMLAAFVEQFGAARSILFRPRMSARLRNQLLRALMPLERLTRGLVLVRAVTNLLMTEQGRRLRLASRIKPPPVRRIATPYVQSVPYPGWRTIARNVTTLPRPRRTPDQAVDPDDPQHWRVQFRILAWSHTATDAQPGVQPKALARAACAHPFAATLESHKRLVRRIEALRRVLEQPDANVRVLMRRLASLPRETLEDFSPLLRVRRRPVLHGVSEQVALTRHARAAMRAFRSSA